MSFPTPLVMDTTPVDVAVTAFPAWRTKAAAAVEVADKATVFADGFRGAVSLALVDADNDGHATLAVTSASGPVSHLKAIDELMSNLPPELATGSRDVDGMKVASTTSTLGIYLEASSIVPGFGEGGIAVSGR